CCARFTPQPDSLPALERHHRPWTLSALFVEPLGRVRSTDPCRTVCVIGPATPAEYDASPPYTPVIAWAPMERLDVVHVAIPPASVAAPQPEIAAPSALNAMLPVGVAALPSMRAVKVTLVPCVIV